MMKCPRCQTLVDETTRATCPRCLIPLSSSQPTAPPGAIPGLPPLPGMPKAAQSGSSVSAPGIPPVAPPPLPGSGAGYAPRPAAPSYARPTPAPQPAAGYAPQAAPIPPAYAGAPQQPYAARTRTTLSGEVIQDSAPAAPGYGTPSPGGYTGAAYGNAPYAPPGSYVPPAAAGSRRSGNSTGRTFGFAGGTVTVLYILLRIALIVARNWDFGSHSGTSGFFAGHSDSPVSASTYESPASVANEALQSMHRMDWKRFYYLSAFANDLEKSDLNASSFQAGFQNAASSNPNGALIIQVVGGMSDISTGSASIHGETAEVPTSCTVAVNGSVYALHGTAYMVRQHGAWLVDLSGENGRSEGTAFADLLGANNITVKSGPGNGLKPGFFMPTPPRFTPPMPSYGNPAMATPNSGGSPYPAAQPGMTPPMPFHHYGNPSSQFGPGGYRPPGFGPGMGGMPGGPGYRPGMPPGQMSQPGMNSGGGYNSGGQPPYGGSGVNSGGTSGGGYSPGASPDSGAAPGYGAGQGGQPGNPGSYGGAAGQPGGSNGP